MKNPNSRNKSSLFACALALGVAFFLAACSNVQKVAYRPPSMAGIQKHPLRVALVLDKAFTEYTLGGNKEIYTYPLGDYLRQSALDVARSTFSDVKQFDSIASASQSTESDAILIPKLVKVEARRVGMAWAKREILVVLEWTMKQRASQKTVWLATVEGTASNKVGTGFSMDRRDREAMQAALEDASRKSINAVQSAQEIKAFSRASAAR